MEGALEPPGDVGQRGDGQESKDCKAAGRCLLDGHLALGAELRVTLSSSGLLGLRRSRADKPWWWPPVVTGCWTRQEPEGGKELSW